MPTMFVKQQVVSYEQWKEAFDTMAPARAEYGLTVEGIYRSINDVNVIFIVLNFADMERAKAFAKSQTLDKGRETALHGGRIAAEVWFSDDQVNVA